MRRDSAYGRDYRGPALEIKHPSLKISMEKQPRTLPQDIHPTRDHR
jgi:hypothetical protein